MRELKLENSPIVYYIDDTSDNEWVVFLHAAFADSRMFRTQTEYFSGRYNLICVDILGHGKSLNADKGDGICKTAYWINRILKKHDIKAAHFVGVSLGAVFAQDYANRYEESVLSLACFGGYDVNDFDKKSQKSNLKQQMGMMLKALFSIKLFAKANKKISAYTSSAQEEFYNLNLQFKKKSFMYLADLNKLVNKYPKTKRKYPLLIGCGEHDIPMEIEIIENWKKKEPCSAVIISAAGHCANMDNPSEFNRVLGDFWLSAGKKRKYFKV